MTVPAPPCRPSPSSSRLNTILRSTSQHSSRPSRRESKTATLFRLRLHTNSVRRHRHPSRRRLPPPPLSSRRRSLPSPRLLHGQYVFHHLFIISLCHSLSQSAPSRPPLTSLSSPIPVANLMISFSGFLLICAHHLYVSTHHLAGISSLCRTSSAHHFDLRLMAISFYCCCITLYLSSVSTEVSRNQA